MKNTNLNYGQSSQINRQSETASLAATPAARPETILSRRKQPKSIHQKFLVTAALLAAFALSGCTLRQAYPQTQIRGYINGQPFSVQAPKDSNLTGFDAIAQTNGAIHVHIDSLQCALTATNLASAANGQAAIIAATAQAVTQAFQSAATAAATTALKAATP